MNRRHLLSAAAGFGAAVFTPEIIHAAAAGQAGWTLGVADVEADVAPHAMRLVHGRAPADLSGVLYRNGPAKFHRPGGSVGHWFDGDGLMRRYQIADGKASMAARFADTVKRRADTKANAVVSAGFGTKGRADAALTGPDDVNGANISVMMAGKDLWALWEAGSPTALDPETLATRGFHTFRDDLKGMPFLAHPRFETDGRVWNLGVSGSQAVVWQLAADGGLTAVTPVLLPQASYVHDFTATERHLVIVLQPWVMGTFVTPILDSYSWKPEQGTKILVLDKSDLSKRRVYDLPGFSFFHMGDAWEDAMGAISFDICTTPTPAFAIQGAKDLIAGRRVQGGAPPSLDLITLSLDGKARREASGLSLEFPRTDARFAGRARSLSAGLGGAKDDNPLFQTVNTHNWKTGRTDRYDFGSRHMAEEVVFTARPGGSDEFDGWLIGTSINLDAKATELHVFDARHVSAGPLCTWRADVALPMSLHGTFVRGV